eukprot:g3054.t1
MVTTRSAGKRSAEEADVEIMDEKEPSIHTIGAPAGSSSNDVGAGAGPAPAQPSIHTIGAPAGSSSNDVGAGAGPAPAQPSIHTIGAPAGSSSNDVGAGAGPAPAPAGAEVPMDTDDTGIVDVAPDNGVGIAAAAVEEVEEEEEEEEDEVEVVPARLVVNGIEVDEDILSARSILGRVKQEPPSAVYTHWDCLFEVGGTGSGDGDGGAGATSQISEDVLNEQRRLWEEIEEVARRDRAAFRASVEGPGAAAYEKLARDAGSAGASTEQIEAAQEALARRIQDWEREQFVVACGNRGGAKFGEALRGASSGSKEGAGTEGIGPLGGLFPTVDGNGSKGDVGTSSTGTSDEDMSPEKHRTPSSASPSASASSSPIVDSSEGQGNGNGKGKRRRADDEDDQEETDDDGSEDRREGGNGNVINNGDNFDKSSSDKKRRDERRVSREEGDENNTK